jgi:acyl-CoA synthetase (AMP-forming)/AMP-acid ligase II
VDDVLRHARSQLAGYKLPRIVRVVHALPLLSNGKLDRKAAERQVVQTIHTS